MKYVQGSVGQILLLLFALAGIGISVYLTIVHYEHVIPVCSNTGMLNCARVLSSAYSVVPGTTVPITIPGLGWCLVSAALAFVGLRLVSPPYWLRLAQFLLALGGIATVLYLVYVELVLVHSICMWCTILHGIILVMFLITLVRLFQPEWEIEAETSDAEEAPVPTLRNQR